MISRTLNSNEVGKTAPVSLSRIVRWLSRALLLAVTIVVATCLAAIAFAVCTLRFMSGGTIFGLTSGTATVMSARLIPLCRTWCRSAFSAGLDS